MADDKQGATDDSPFFTRVTNKVKSAIGTTNKPPNGGYVDQTDDVGIRGETDNDGENDPSFADGGPVTDDPFNTTSGSTTDRISKGLAAVNAIMMYGRQSAGLPAHGISRFGGLGSLGVGGHGEGKAESSGDFNTDSNGFDPNNNGFGSSSGGSDSGGDNSDD